MFLHSACTAPVLCLLILSVTYLVVQCSGIGNCSVSYNVFSQTALDTNIHWNELLIWFKVSGF